MNYQFNESNGGVVVKVQEWDITICEFFMTYDQLLEFYHAMGDEVLKAIINGKFRPSQQV